MRKLGREKASLWRKHKMPGKQFRFGTYPLGHFACFISSDSRAKRDIRYNVVQTPSFGDKKGVSVLLKVVWLKPGLPLQNNELFIRPHHVSQVLTERARTGVQLACPWAAVLVVKVLKHVSVLVRWLVLPWTSKAPTHYPPTLASPSE